MVELVSDFVVCEEGKPLSPESARILVSSGCFNFTGYFACSGFCSPHCCRMILPFFIMFVQVSLWFYMCCVVVDVKSVACLSLMLAILLPCGLMLTLKIRLPVIFVIDKIQLLCQLLNNGNGYYIRNKAALSQHSSKSEKGVQGSLACTPFRTWLFSACVHLAPTFSVCFSNP